MDFDKGVDLDADVNKEFDLDLSDIDSDIDVGSDVELKINVIDSGLDEDTNAVYVDVFWSVVRFDADVVFNVKNEVEFVNSREGDGGVIVDSFVFLIVDEVSVVFACKDAVILQ